MSTKCLPDDEQFNISFVQTVEKYACLYDHTLKAYSNRSEQDKAWNQVAGVYFSTGPECKKKWKILRGSLTRYLKQRDGKSGCSAKSKKKYYLWNVMQFVLPFTKSRPQSGNLPNSTEDEVAEDSSSSVDGDDEDPTPASSGEHPPVHPTQADSNSSCTPSLSSRPSTKRKAKPPVDEMESAIVGYLSQKNARIPENPDFNFFKSILPDVAALNTSQKRRFKVLILQTLDNMLQETSTSANTSSVFNDRPASSFSTHSNDTAASTQTHVYNNHTNDFVLDSSSGMFINDSTYL